MGEGVMNILGLLADLCVADGKLFLLEEPENDIHPRALKSLMKFICERAESNQLIVTTHSNIVAKCLGARSDTKLFHTTITYPNRVPTSEIKEVGNSSEARLAVLEGLGYEPSDVDLWDAWLFLEESSAEKIVREYLIPWFAPELAGKLRTFSARALSEVETKFEDFNNLFVFLHLSPAYKNRVWVILDGGEDEAKVVKKLQAAYLPNDWKADQFSQFGQHDFERYYPASFAGEVEAVLTTVDKQQKRMKKRELLQKVEDWIRKDADAAKAEFAKSAAEVIDKLRMIEKTIC